MMFIMNKIKLFHLFGISPTISKTIRFTQKRNCYSIFGIKDLVQHEKVRVKTCSLTLRTWKEGYE